MTEKWIKNGFLQPKNPCPLTGSQDSFKNTLPLDGKMKRP